MNLKSKKKGFTIVELVIVIAVVGILAAILIPTFVGLVKKSKVSADVMTVSNINKALAIDEGKYGKTPNTYGEMLNVAKEYGYDISKLNPTAEGYTIVYDIKENVLYLYDEEGKLANNQKGTPSEKEYLWMISTENTLPETLSEDSLAGNIYLNNVDVASVKVSYGIETVGATDVNFVTDNNGTYTIVMNGGILTVNAPNATINSYGQKETVNIESVADHSLYENGEVKGNIYLKKGHLSISSTANVYSVLITAENYDVNKNTVRVDVLGSKSLQTVVGATNEGFANALLTGSQNFNIPTKNIASTVLKQNENISTGFGTEQSPYLINTVEEFLAIDKVGVGTEENNIYYKLNNNISLDNTAITGEWYTGIGYLVKNFVYSHLDGNGYTISAKKDSSVFYQIIELFTNSSIKNVVLELAGNVTLVTKSTNVSYENIIVNGNLSYSNNSGVLTVYAFEGTVDVKNCTNNANITAGGASSNYNAVWVGQAIRSSQITFENCVNNGNLISGKAGLFLANANVKNGLNVTIKNCVNNGSIRATYMDYTPNQFFAVYNYNPVVNFDGETVEINSGKLTGFYQGPNDTIVVTKNEDGTISFTKSNISTVVKYEISLTFYASIVEGGSHVNFINEVIDATSADSYTSTLKLLKVTIGGDGYSASSDILGYETVVKDGVQYYLFNVEGETLNSNILPTVTVSAYDANGNLVSSATL